MRLMSVLAGLGRLSSFWLGPRLCGADSRRGEKSKMRQRHARQEHRTIRNRYQARLRRNEQRKKLKGGKAYPRRPTSLAWGLSALLPLFTV
ncbi:hypothetical protein V8C35DRAFT_288332 [Trichoderma chlorosporum]